MKPAKPAVRVLILAIALTVQYQTASAEDRSPAAAAPPAPATSSSAQSSGPRQVSLTESDLQITALGGLVLNSSRTGISTGFGANVTYRPFSRLPRLALGGYFALSPQPGSVTFTVFGARGEYALQDENKGFVLGLGAGLGSTSNNSSKGVTVSPDVGYYIPFIGDLTVGANVGADVLPSAPSMVNTNARLGLRLYL